MRELGYVEGQNLVIEYRFADGSPNPLSRLAAEMVRLRVDVIVATATPATEAVSRVTKTIPIVFVGVADPVGLGIIQSLAHLGGNLTGLSISSADLTGKRAQLLQENFRVRWTI